MISMVKTSVRSYKFLLMSILYGSNRGHDIIVIFAIEPNSLLTYFAHESTPGKIPRNFELVANSPFLIVVNQDSENLVSFRVRPKGLLTRT